ncbi:hypothetical protein GALL_460880 [mine drainage metagenome]|uniref:Uncharacterized protein n=1 Tax=mine drainage metagenome TaxID=410659 RepID=A0A1J5PXJ5_9ZZZZ
MMLQELGDLERVVVDAVHAQRQGFDALQDQECVERRQGSPGVAQRNHAGAANVSRRAKGFGVNHAVVAWVRLIEAVEPGLVLGPGELAGVDDRPAQAVAVPTQVFGE